jgi:hypothetical protein
MDAEITNQITPEIPTVFTGAKLLTLRQARATAGPLTLLGQTFHDPH